MPGFSQKYGQKLPGKLGPKPAGTPIRPAGRHGAGAEKSQSEKDLFDVKHFFQFAGDRAEI